MSKGGEYEREICKQISSWWLGTDDDDICFWRTSQSGGRATQRAKLQKKTTRAHCGDICALDERGRSLTDLIACELKRGYPKASIHALLDCTDDSAEQIYEKWIVQAQESARHAGVPFWAIIHKRNRCATTLTVPHRLWLELDIDTDGQHRMQIQAPVVEMEVIVVDKKEYIVCCQFDAFLKAVHPDVIRQVSTKYATASSVPVPQSALA